MTDGIAPRGWLLMLADSMNVTYVYTRTGVSAAPQLTGGPLKSSSYITGWD